MCQTDKSCPFQNRGAQSEHVLFGKGKCGISTESVNEGFDLEDFSDSGSEENIVDSGKEFVPVDRKVDSSDSNNNTFIFIIGIHATSKINPFFSFFFLLCLDSSCFTAETEKGIWYDTMVYLSDKYASQAF